jgi:hypothetical protein
MIWQNIQRSEVSAALRHRLKVRKTNDLTVQNRYQKNIGGHPSFKGSFGVRSLQKFILHFVWNVALVSVGPSPAGDVLHRADVAAFHRSYRRGTVFLDTVGQLVEPAISNVVIVYTP